MSTIINDTGFNSTVDINTQLTPALGSVTGDAEWSMPFQGNSFKKVVINFNSLNGTTTITFPTPFTIVPAVIGTAATLSAYSSLTTTSVVLTGNYPISTTNGYLSFEGF